MIQMSCLPMFEICSAEGKSGWAVPVCCTVVGLSVRGSAVSGTKLGWLDGAVYKELHPEQQH